MGLFGYLRRATANASPCPVGHEAIGNWSGVGEHMRGVWARSGARLAGQGMGGCGEEGKTEKEGEG